MENVPLSWSRSRSAAPCVPSAGLSFTLETGSKSCYPGPATPTWSFPFPAALASNGSLWCICLYFHLSPAHDHNYQAPDLKVQMCLDSNVVKPSNGLSPQKSFQDSSRTGDDRIQAETQAGQSTQPLAEGYHQRTGTAHGREQKRRGEEKKRSRNVHSRHNETHQGKHGVFEKTGKGTEEQQQTEQKGKGLTLLTDDP